MHCHIAKLLQPILQLLLPPWQEAGGKRLPLQEADQQPRQTVREGEHQQSRQTVRSQSSPASLFLEQILAANIAQSLYKAAGGASIPKFMAKITFLFKKEKGLQFAEKFSFGRKNICLHFAHTDLLKAKTTVSTSVSLCKYKLLI